MTSLLIPLLVAAAGEGTRMQTGTRLAQWNVPPATVQADTGEIARRWLGAHDRPLSASAANESRPVCPMPVMRPRDPASLTPPEPEGPPPTIPRPNPMDSMRLPVELRPGMPTVRSGCWNPLDQPIARPQVDSVRLKE